MMTKKVGFLKPPTKKDIVKPPSVAERCNAELRARIAKVQLLGLDVDGVMTDGRLYYHDDGTETKAFDVRDGHGIKMLQHAGIEVFIISGRSSPMVTKRAEDLGISEVTQGVRDKVPVLEALLTKKGFETDQVAYMGDDVVDLPVMTRVGLAIAVADASEHIFDGAHYITLAPAGRGAVREVVELILGVKGLWEKMAHVYYQ